MASGSPPLLPVDHLARPNQPLENGQAARPRQPGACGVLDFGLTGNIGRGAAVLMLGSRAHRYVRVRLGAAVVELVCDVWRVACDVMGGVLGKVATTVIVLGWIGKQGDMSGTAQGPRSMSRSAVAVWNAAVWKIPKRPARSRWGLLARGCSSAYSCRLSVATGLSSPAADTLRVSPSARGRLMNGA